MAETRGAIVVCLVILALDATAGVLAIQAQAAENKTKTVAMIIFGCKAPVHKAYQLGLAAAVLLVVAHTTASIFGGGFACIFSRLESVRAFLNRTLALLSWSALVLAFSLLLAGAMSHTKSKTSCGFIHFDTLAAGANMCFVHGVITVAYYVMATVAGRQFA